MGGITKADGGEEGLIHLGPRQSLAGQEILVAEDAATRRFDDRRAQGIDGCILVAVCLVVEAHTAGLR